MPANRRDVARLSTGALEREVARLDRDLRSGRISPNAHGNTLVRMTDIRRELDKRSGRDA